MLMGRPFKVSAAKSMESILRPESDLNCDACFEAVVSLARPNISARRVLLEGPSWFLKRPLMSFTKSTQ